MFAKKSTNYINTFIFITSIFIGLSFYNCSSDSEDNETYELTITPNGTTINQNGAVTVSATLSPQPSSTVTFDWFTLGLLGQISDEQPNGQVSDDSDDGQSSVVYTATPIGNPGGTETLSVDVLDQNGTKIAEGVIEIEVNPPSEQIAYGELYEWTRPSGQDNRLSTSFIVVWSFFKLPGFSLYDFTLEVEPGEGWDAGPLGSVQTYGLGGGLVDRDIFVENYGADFFELEDDKWALIASGGGHNNYEPDDVNALENIELSRQSFERYIQAVYSVRAHGTID